MYDIEKGTFEGLNKRLKQLLKNDKFCKGIEKMKTIMSQKRECWCIMGTKRKLQ